MKTDEQLKQIVKETYSGIVDQNKEQNETSCCGATCGCSTVDEAIMAEDYEKLSGYVKDADLGLGCGLPTEYAQIKEANKSQKLRLHVLTQHPTKKDLSIRTS